MSYLPDVEESTIKVHTCLVRTPSGVSRCPLKTGFTVHAVGKQCLRVNNAPINRSVTGWVAMVLGMHAVVVGKPFTLLRDTLHVNICQFLSHRMPCLPSLSHVCYSFGMQSKEKKSV